MSGELPTWWPLSEWQDEDRFGVFTDVFEAACVFQLNNGGGYHVFDAVYGDGGTLTECDTLLEVFAVLIEIAKRKAPHTLPPSYLEG